MKQRFIVLVLATVPAFLFAQSNKIPRYFGNPVVLDSTSSILMICIYYNSERLSTNKLALWNDYCANIVFYNFKTDSSRQLFPSDTFIKRIENDYADPYTIAANSFLYVSPDWIFYLVKPVDYDNNRKVDGTDPSVLYVSDKTGHHLKALTPPNENAVSIALYDKQGFAFVKMQRDSDRDKDFESNDKDFYYFRLDLHTLAAGNKIELGL